MGSEGARLNASSGNSSTVSRVRSLVTLLTVSRSFNQAAERALVERLTIDYYLPPVKRSNRQIMFLSNLLTKKPHLLFYVKELTINFHPASFPSRGLNPFSYSNEDAAQPIFLFVLRLLHESPISTLKIRAIEGHYLDRHPANSDTLNDQLNYPLSCALTSLRFKPGTLENKLRTLHIQNMANVPPLLVSAVDSEPSEPKLTSLTIQNSYSTCLVADMPFGDKRPIGPLYPFRRHPSDESNPLQDIPPPTFSANPYEFLTELNIQDLKSLGKNFAPHYVFSNETAVHPHFGTPELQQGVFRLPNLKSLTLGHTRNDGGHFGVIADNYSLFAIVKHWAPVLENLVIQDGFSSGIIVETYPLEVYLQTLNTIPLKSLSIIDTGNGGLSNLTFPLIIDSFSQGLQRHKTLQHLSVRFNGLELNRYYALANPRFGAMDPLSIFSDPEEWGLPIPSKVASVVRLLSLMRFNKLERFDLDMVRINSRDPLDFDFGGGPIREAAARVRAQKWARHEGIRNDAFTVDLAEALSLNGQIRTRVRIMQKKAPVPNSLRL